MASNPMQRQKEYHFIRNVSNVNYSSNSNSFTIYAIN